MEEPSEDDVFHGGGGDLVSDREAAASPESTGSLCSSAMSSLTDNDADDDGAESAFSAIGDRTSWSSSSSSDTMQLGGPLYEMSPLLAHLPASCHRTGLSKYYNGKSQSFTSLSDVKCLQDLEKKASPYASRIKKTRSSISNHVPGPCGKTMAKKTQPKSSSDRLLSRAKSSGLLRRRGKPPVYQSKQELSTYVS
ncbi:uncharacterized protein LOC100843946 [Brachypodium distachyon]|uniref:Oxidative stress 3 n=1 Tax=Brachypodium distachyon TaxID=15368 RepID=I1GY05_BRADI|nr:uncharacterized protein LOC100843946 [Brachypodium distachyon]KQK17991.1 hypothetical protein BRADI_1g37930v3 [Brachypodium distachyon]|eukprot:XP_010227607.1 uncharacterized protein LOC100843946 [Brachypodium distachyon]